jgi:tripartite motif-containing protein 71
MSAVGCQGIAVFLRKDIRDPDFFKEKKLPKQAEPQEKVELKFLKGWGKAGQGSGAFLEPRDIAVSEDGFVYVADTKNHRIQKFSSEGDFLLSFGSQGSEKGQFKEPTGVGVGRNGTVYVADTWNHRIQVFDADGKFLFEFKGGNEGFWAPKDVAVDSKGDIHVTDTGYHRIQKFSKEGKFLMSWGGKGETVPGVFSEPVGLFVDAADRR